MQALADNHGACVLAEDGSRLLFLRRRILPSWLAFVLLLVAVVAGGNGGVQLAAGVPAAGAALLGLGAVAALGGWAVVRRRRRVRSAPLDAGDALLVVDLGTGRLLDGAGSELAPLSAVRFDQAMQATSSSRALRASWPGGSLVVYRGDAMSPRGSIGPAVEALRAHGITVA